MKMTQEDEAHTINIKTLHQNKNVAEKLIAFFESIKTEMKQIPVARKRN
jgi:hypothetical protein